MEWEPINTAPHGEMVLAISKGECYFLVQRWHTGRVFFLGDGFDPDGGRTLSPEEMADNVEYDLIGWKPLPPPPSE